MENNELKKLWDSYNKTAETNLKINLKMIEYTSDLRLKSLLNSMKPTKVVSVVIGVLWVIFLNTIIIKTFGSASWFFTISAIIQVFLTQLAIGIYLYQLITIEQIDFSEPILRTQEKLSSLKSSTLWTARILFLQLPVWSTFYLHSALFTTDNTFWLIVQVIVTFLLTYLAIWLFININAKNKDKKWFRILFTGKEWTPVLKSMELLDELKAFRAN